MKFVLASAIFLGLAAFVQGQLTINTPAAPVVCQPTLITWSGGTAPYFVSIVPQGNPSNAIPLLSFNQTNSFSVSWDVNLQAGTMINFAIKDSTGTTGVSGSVTVQAGSNTNCTTTTSYSFGTATTAAATATAPVTPATSTSSGTTLAGVVSSPSTNTGASATAATSAGATSTARSGASRVTGQVAAAGIIGVAIAALLG